MSKKASQPARTLLVKDEGGEFKIDLPEGARVTFGPDVPFESKSNSSFHGKRSYSLRVYAGKGNDTLIAVFAHVENFRPLSMPHAKLIVREAGKSLWKSDETGYSTETAVERKETFVDSARLLSQ